MRAINIVACVVSALVISNPAKAEEAEENERSAQGDSRTNEGVESHEGETSVVPDTFPDAEPDTGVQAIQPHSEGTDERTTELYHIEQERTAESDPSTEIDLSYLRLYAMAREACWRPVDANIFENMGNYTLAFDSPQDRASRLHRTSASLMISATLTGSITLLTMLKDILLLSIANSLGTSDDRMLGIRLGVVGGVGAALTTGLAVGSSVAGRRAESVTSEEEKLRIEQQVRTYLSNIFQNAYADEHLDLEDYIESVNYNWVRHSTMVQIRVPNTTHTDLILIWHGALGSRNMTSRVEYNACVESSFLRTLAARAQNSTLE